ncbi:CHASE3 domain-containing protein [Flavobacterium sp.]|uniref:CHASE3 domain-containing protein n=1 Tax=Flavobacterium sp. TaxID=239 RepID=UPI0025BC1F84|nr:CHASE3 domain-containing protein [Flavobacterium sp.]
MKIKKYVSPSFVLTVVFVLSIFTLFFIGSISFKQIRTMSETQKAITHSLDVRVELERLFSELKDAESAHRGYLLTHDERYLEPYNYSHVHINKSLLSIKKLTQSNQKRKAEFDTLYVMINERFRVFRDNINQSKRFRNDSPEFKEQIWKGKLVMDRIRLQINQIVESENKILEAQQKAHEDEITFTPFTSSFLVIFSIIVFLLTFLKLKNNVKRMRLLNQSLKHVNETFAYAENIGEICHWEYDLKSKKLTFSDNRFKLLACEIDSFEPTVKNFLKFVHPQDRRRVNDCFVKSLNQTPFIIQYKVIRADRKGRVFRTISKLVTDSSGRETIIGIDCDITSQHRNTVKLEQKNKELASTNSELSSFNHIVSHDLQEPMRKIQMFISRIDENDLKLISDNSRSYLLRIQSSANRAQKLIDDLLVYSRLNRNEKQPENTNLNELLENAKTDLAQVIEEKHATFLSDKLPTIRVTPYQIQQLFVNLISNSIKYAREDVKPEINITYQIVDAKDVAKLKKQSGRKYHEIAFSDNGIGFEPEYESKIFVLFHRLHDKEKYSGTGIGLAICKKMAESHDGFIFAEGNPGSGATFRLYLPVL